MRWWIIALVFIAVSPARLKETNNFKKILTQDAVIVSSVLFGLLHNGGMERRLGCVLGGFFFAAILLVSKNLLASIMAHGAVNGLYIVARFIGVKCPKLFFVWPCGRLLGATWPVWAACILLCAVGVWLLLSQKRRATQPEPDDSGVIDT